MVVTRSGKGSRSSPSADRQQRETETEDTQEPVTTAADEPKPVAASSNPTTSGTETTSYETTTAMTSSYEYSETTVTEKRATTEPPGSRDDVTAQPPAAQPGPAPPAPAHPDAAKVADVPRSQTAGGHSVRLAASTRTNKSRRSTKTKRLAKEKEELLQLQIEHRLARIARIEAEISESDEDTVISDIESRHRVADWVRQSQQQQQLQPIEEPPRKRTEANKAIDYKRMPMSAAFAPKKIPVATPAGERPITVKQQTLDITELAQAITFAAQSARPIARNFTELQQYGGSHQEWLSFKAAYTATAPSYTDIENLARLRKALRGAAREAVENLLMYNTHPADVLRVLESRFGRPDAIAQVELDRLRALPRLTDAAREVCVFSTKINNIVAALRALKKQHYLYSPEVTKTTIDKFTPALRYRWYDFAAAQPEEEADLIKLARFLQRESERCAPYAQPEQISTQPLRSNNGTAAPARRAQNTYIANAEKSTCPACDKDGHNSATKCPRYMEANVDDRWDVAKQKSLCYRCLRKRTQKHSCKPTKCNIDGCPRTHHPMLHFVKREIEEKEMKEIVGTAWVPRQSHSYLKILPVTVSGPRGYVKTHALLDDGSTVTLVDADIARKIGARGPIEPLHIEALSSEVGVSQSQRVKLTIQGNTETNIQARTIENIRLSPQQVEHSDLMQCPHLIDIADQLIYQATPKILIGQDNWELLLATETRRGAGHQPVASLTPLGWVLHGAHTRTLGHRVHYANCTATAEADMDEQLRRYFAIESLTVTPKRPQNDPEQRALKMLNEHTVRRADGHYEVPLLWRRDDVTMPDNYDSALKRLQSIERKLDRNPELKQKYEEQMNALIEKGYAEPAPATKTEKRTWYLPHFPVVNPRKPEKMRIVHDAASKTRGMSLNDYLLTGPDLLQSLPGVLMRLRQHRYAVSADIREMFMQVKIRAEDRDALRYLWRGAERGEHTPREYRMTSLIFGATSSPATAIYVKNINAARNKEKEPHVYDAVVRNHYVDDYLQSFETADQAITMARRVREIHSEAHFELRQWASNSPEVLAALTENSSPSQPVSLGDGTKPERVLGLIWKPDSDELTFNLNLARLPQDAMDNERPTKREALRIIMSVFDPLGFASPVTSRPRQLLQEIWRRGTEWDQPIDADLAAQWRDAMGHLKQLANTSLPRCHPHYSDAANLQLHVFVDASETAFAAALYWRAQAPDGLITTSLILGKSKVAPLKVTSIPRLELQAAVMGSYMATAVVEEHDRKPQSVTYWTDSRTVLTWLKTGARSYKPYVAHRIAAIEENSKLSDWRWIPTKLNVADDATRDVPEGFNSNHRWFCGPAFLRQDSSTWPAEVPTNKIETGEERTHYATEKRAGPNLAEALPQHDRFSKWERLLRTTARVLQFIERCRTKTERASYARTAKKKENDATWGRKYRTLRPQTRQLQQKGKQYIPIEARFVIRAERLLMRATQQQTLKEEIETLRSGGTVANNSRLRPLAVEIVDGVIKLKTRIGATVGITEEAKSPIVIDGDHPTVKLYISYVHRKLHHASTEATINECRQHYWILRLRPTARTVIHRCLPCRFRRSKPPQPSTGDHPRMRLAHHRRPFTYTGVDYFGPISVTVGRNTQKRYVALFTCLTTRAVHLEIAASLTTDSAVMALRRFIARRGRPTEIWSDNGTNLQGANKELRRAIDHATQEEATTNRINWRFIPPSAPFMGGAWERLVRSVKTALYTVLQQRCPHEEVLHTLLCEVEYTVNSRPLTHVSIDPTDPEAITPNHFLLGGSGRVTTPGNFEDSDLIGRANWKASQRLADLFWARWLKEYLPELQHRREPRNRGAALNIDDVVLIADSTLPRNIWPRGVVIATYPGADGVVRAADVKTKGGILRRPTKKLVILQTTQTTSLPRIEDASTGASTDNARRE